ncbi:MAG: protein translocase subunit SecF [Nanoarchaeota archaeon]|nr:protein translocase subunit SecF [Nanoarchaeota archaeon]
MEQSDEHQKSQISHEQKSFYDKYYKTFLIIPVLMLIFSGVYLFSFYSQNGDIMYKDVTLTGGTSITIYSENISSNEIESFLKPKFGDVVVRSLTDIKTGKTIALSVETASTPEELTKELESFLEYSLDETNSSTEFTGDALSKSFYKELMRAIFIAFFFMSIVVFILFRSPLPCLYVILCAFSDLIIPLAIVNYFGISLSTAGIAAFLMLIGYSVDTDILLTTRVLKRKEEGTLNQRIFGAMKTGLTMTLTALVAVAIAYFIVISPTLKQVFLVLSVGLIVDLIITWGMNAGLIKWYCERKGYR